MAKKIFNFGERLALYEDLPANTQYNTMPEPNIENINNIIQYTGDTNQNYTNGYYYKCISDGQDPATYSWQRVDVQPNEDLSNYVESITVPITLLAIQPGMTSEEIIQCLGGLDNVHKLWEAFDAGKPVFGTALVPGQHDMDYVQVPMLIDYTNMSTYSIIHFNAMVSGESWDMVLQAGWDDDWSVISVTKTPLNPQYDSLPTPGADNEGQIIQYVGPTNQNYTNGYFYKCVSDGQNPATYSWEVISVQKSDSRIDYAAPQTSYLPGNAFDYNTAKKGVYHLVGSTGPNKTIYGLPVTNMYIDYVAIWKEKSEATNLESVGAIVGYDANGKRIIRELKYSTASGGLVDGGFNRNIRNGNEVWLLKTNQTFDGVKTFTSIPKQSDTTAPTQDTEFTNKKYVDDLIAGIDITDREIVQQLPTQDISTKTIYMVPSSDPSAQNVYEEYMYINSAWELIGSTSIDLSNYYTKSEVDAMITNLNNQIGNIAEVLSHLTNPVIPIGTVLYTEDVSRTVGNVTYEGTYTATVKEFHADTNYYVIDYTFENTGADDIPGAVFDEITTDPAGHLPLMAAYTIEAGETVTLTSYWQDSATYAATEARYQVPGNVSVEFDTTDNTNNYTSNLALNKLDGFTTDVVAHVHAYDSSEIDEGWTHTTFSRTGGTEDPYTVPEPFTVAWINFEEQTFGTLSGPISDTLTMTRSYIGFNADQFDQNNVAFFLAKMSDIEDCTWEEFEAAYYDYTGGVN